MKLDIIKAGILGYSQGWELQKSLVEKRAAEKINDTLILLEHPPVITRGKRGKDADIIFPVETLKNRGIEVFDIERGGETTYHGPGQLVGYLIINLYNHERSLKVFVHNIEEVIIRTLHREWKIDARRDPEHIGVWVGNEKIAAIGISITRKVTMHGFAFNINTDLSHFKWIIPCGITDKETTSVEKICGRKQDFEKAAEAVGSVFTQVYGYDEVTHSTL